MNIEYQYYVCHEGQRWLVWGLVEALVSIQWIRIAQIDTRTHLPTELILHSLPFGCFFVFFISCIHFFIHSVDFWKGRGDISWGVHVLFFFFLKKKRKKSSDFKCNICRLQGHWQLYFPSPSSLSLSLWNRSFVCKELKRSGRRIQSSAGNASRAEMLLGKEAGKRQKTSPLSPSAHMTLGPEWASERAGGGTAQQALMHTQRNLEGRVERGSASPGPPLKWVQINWYKTFKGQYKFDLSSAY